MVGPEYDGSRLGMETSLFGGIRMTIITFTCQGLCWTCVNAQREAPEASLFPSCLCPSRWISAAAACWELLLLLPQGRWGGLQSFSRSQSLWLLHQWSLPASLELSPLWGCLGPRLSCSLGCVWILSTTSRGNAGALTGGTYQRNIVGYAFLLIGTSDPIVFLLIKEC